MSKRAEEAALKAYQDKVFRYKKIGDADGVMTGESVDSQQYIRDYFIEGYEQAEKETIERALKWLKFNVEAYTWYNEMNGESGISEDFFEDFKKAMEEN